MKSAIYAGITMVLSVASGTMYPVTQPISNAPLNAVIGWLITLVFLNAALRSISE